MRYFCIVSYDYMDNNTVKTNIFMFRKCNGISQCEMAKKLGISRNAYRNLEKGSAVLINEDALNRIAGILGTSTESIVLGYQVDDSFSQRIVDVEAKYISKIRRISEDYNAQIKVLNDRIKDKDDIIGFLRNSLEELELKVKEQQKG